jgi:hypothetical protein
VLADADDDSIAGVDECLLLLAIVLPGSEPDPEGFADALATVVDTPLREMAEVVLDRRVQVLESPS